MDVDGDGGRREFGLRDQRLGIEVIWESPQIRSPDITLPVEKDSGLSAALVMK